MTCWECPCIIKNVHAKNKGRVMSTGKKTNRVCTNQFKPVMEMLYQYVIPLNYFPGVL